MHLPISEAQEKLLPPPLPSFLAPLFASAEPAFSTFTSGLRHTLLDTGDLLQAGGALYFLDQRFASTMLIHLSGSCQMQP
jgi:hypothetical protein